MKCPKCSKRYRPGPGWILCRCGCQFAHSLWVAYGMVPGESKDQEAEREPAL